MLSEQTIELLKELRDSFNETMDSLLFDIEGETDYDYDADEDATLDDSDIDELHKRVSDIPNMFNDDSMSALCPRELTPEEQYLYNWDED